jgi:dihydroxyacetone kinase-like predicted kinase
MGLCENKVEVLGKNLEDVALETIGRMVDGGTEFVTVYYGEGVSPEDAQGLSEKLEKKFDGNIEVLSVYGGQPVYYYIAAIE